MGEGCVVAYGCLCQAARPALRSSSGTTADLTCFLAARGVQAGWDIRKQGVDGGPGRQPALRFAARATARSAARLFIASL